MNVLVTGRGTSGSWQIRGEQLGNAIGATVEANVTDVLGYNLAIVVKRYRPELLHRLRWAKLPIVWDVLDAWPQPHGNFWSEHEGKTWIQRQIEVLRPVALVGATRAMAQDMEDFGVPVLALPHHARPEQALNPIREHVQIVGYEGGEHYLGRWRKVLENACARRGWIFVINPASLAALDIVVALREPSGYPARRWKSNVKLANAQDTGTPCIVNYESGYLETRSGAECFVESESEIEAALDELTPQAERMKRSIQLRQAAPHLSAIAVRYRAWLEQLLK